MNVECKSRYFCDLWPLCSCLLISIKILLQSRARLAHQALNVHINRGASFLLVPSPAVVTDGDVRWVESALCVPVCQNVYTWGFWKTVAHSQNNYRLIKHKILHRNQTVKKLYHQILKILRFGKEPVPQAVSKNLGGGGWSISGHNTHIHIE